jgi:hypothetical protein
MRISAMLLIPVVALAACSQPTSPSAVATPPAAPPPTSAVPAPGAPPLPRGPFALTGIITERTPRGEQPVGAANVNVWVQTATIGYSYWYANGPQMTDSQGRYQLANLPADATLHFDTWKDGFVQQCAAPQLVANGDLRLDAQLVSRANVSASPDSVPGPAPGFRLISGVVYELTADGRGMASNAFVDYEPLEDFPAATTYTDAQGRFLLCGIPQARNATIGASLGMGRVAYRSVPAGTDASIEIEIK